MAVEFKFDFKRTLAAIMYVASKDVPELTTYKLCKLIFLADKYHLVRYGRSITGDIYVAMDDGPVPSALYDLLKFLLAQRSPNPRAAALIDNLQVDKKYRYPRISAVKHFNADELSRSDIAALDKAIDTYGHMDFFQLKAITHEMVAYKKAWEKQRPDGAKQWPMTFEDFFEEDPNAIAGALEEMTENHVIRKALR